MLRRCANGEAPWPVYLRGPAGTGKTCAALALADQVRYGAWYRQCRDFVDDWRKVVLGQAVAELGYAIYPADFWRRVESRPLAILDEIGDRCKVTDTHYDAVKGFLDRRHKRPTVVLGNLDAKQLAEVYDDRIASRVCAGTVIFLAGKDRRRSG